METRCVIWIFLMFCAALVQSQALTELSQSATAIAAFQLTDRQIKYEFAKIGEPISFRWNSNRNRTIDYCRWDRVVPNYNENTYQKPFSISTTVSNTTRGYSISKNGLEFGFCQLTITDVQRIDMTLWNCTIVPKEASGDGPALGTVNLTSFVKPSRPTLSKDKLKYLVDSTNDPGNSTRDIICCADGGIPSPKLTIWIGENVLRESPHYSHQNQTGRFGEKFCLKLEQVKLNWTDYGKQITCRAEHSAYDYSDVKEDSFELNIFHEPRVKSKLVNQEINFHVDAHSSHARIFIEFSANPMAKMHWLIKSKNGKYESLPESYKHNLEENLTQLTWEAGLILNPSEMSSKSESFLLTLKNSYGYKEIQVHVYKATGLANWIWILMFVFGGIALFLIVGAVFTLFARRNGWFCFQVRTGSLDVYEPPKTKRKNAPRELPVVYKPVKTTEPRTTDQRLKSSPVQIEVRQALGRDEVYVSPSTTI